MFACPQLPCKNVLGFVSQNGVPGEKSIVFTSKNLATNWCLLHGKLC